MNRRTVIKAIVPLVGILWGVSAQAFTVDFANIADTEGEAGFAAWNRSFSGTSLTATGTSIGDTDSNPDYFAYLDAGNAGLGVCKVINSSDQCTPSSDDNVTFGEVLTLDFDSQVTLSSLFFRNGNHGTNFGSAADIEISIDNGSFQSYALVSNFTIPLSGSNFRFIADSNGDGDQIYLSSLSAEASSSVPVPAPLALMGLTLVGMGWQKRKKQ